MPKKQSKLNIVLDLDATLICAESSEDFDFKNNMFKACKFKFHDMDGYYIVFERPGLQEFLDFLFKNFTVSIWTAASKDYALYIIDNIILPENKPDRKLDWAFFSYHCDISKEKKKASKSLSMFWDEYKMVGYTKDNTLILDDYDEVYNTQKDNCVIVKDFAFDKEGSENDNFLPLLQKALSKATPGNPAKSVNLFTGAKHKK
jgi:TFIIF-interacting CTD phosphatase-like protein|uniref:FCP1 homology domain-containing protein n=1 Tax=viral metagenome TaxID=1070528 RepID=A0A6C0LXL4_9ZZZZ